MIKTIRSVFFAQGLSKHLFSWKYYLVTQKNIMTNYLQWYKIMNSTTVNTYTYDSGNNKFIGLLNFYLFFYPEDFLKFSAFLKSVYIYISHLFFQTFEIINFTDQQAPPKHLNGYLIKNQDSYSLNLTWSAPCYHVSLPLVSISS